jgi:hypothetical protein
MLRQWALFYNSTGQISKLSSIWRRFESDRHPNYFVSSHFTIFSIFLFFPDHFKVIKSVFLFYKRLKNVSYCENKLYFNKRFREIKEQCSDFFTARHVLSGASCSVTGVPADQIRKLRQSKFENPFYNKIHIFCIKYNWKLYWKLSHYKIRMKKLNK